MARAAESDVPTEEMEGGSSLTERMVDRFLALRLEDLSPKARDVAIDDLIDMAGNCLSARRTEYMRALLESCDDDGACTALGHARPLRAADAALMNGTGTHGEDFDDTLEGAPIRVGAMVIPAALAAGERHGRSGADTLRGIICGLEMVCRMNHVAPGAIHKACFHPVGVIGAIGAVVGASVTLGLDRQQFVNALGIAGSLSSGILEYLTDGASTKRLHPGWAAQSGLRAAVMARAGYDGPRSLLEGPHGFFKAFAPSAKQPRFSYLTDGLGESWMMKNITFKPYACGTMIHPYIDCMIRLAEQGVDADDIVAIECETGEGLVDRLWEPLASKHRPPSGYAAKFSMPFGMAVGFFDRAAGLEQFTDEKACDPKILALAGRIRYVIDPQNEYPVNYTGHIRVGLRNGSEIELRQPHMRGGKREPLSREELVRKFHGNAEYGGWRSGDAGALLDFCLGIAQAPDLSGLARFRL
ncbi:MAG TPA: MmgE/PrpD family protein [Dongiaceae bacterium]|jgi:2-methylcitrate dehydratase PrpD|nr:MmgE/PrpD family protein [Dongiaceae bacterium]